MTRNYNRSYLFSFNELSDDQQRDVMRNYFDELSDAHSTQYVISKFKDQKEAVPLCLFMRTDGNNFTHGIHADSFFSGYYITLSRCGQEAVIAYKYF
jgi:hypothetical protein